MKKSLILIYIILLAVSGLFAQEWDQIIKVVATNRAAMDRFAYSVDIDGDRAIVGAYYEDEDENDANTLLSPGSAYIFIKNGDTWVQEQKLVASDRAANDLFGYSVAISGNYAIVGAHGDNEDAAGLNYMDRSGSAYIYYFNGASWIQQQKLVSSDRAANDYFGADVAIFGDYILIGAYAEDENESGTNTFSAAGSAYIFTRNGSVWAQQQKIVASDRAQSDYFGNCVAISGDYAIVGTWGEDEDAAGDNYMGNAGSAYIYYFNGSSWLQQQKIVASDRQSSDYFGTRAAISGDKVIVGAYNDNQDAGSAYIFSRTNTTWSQEQKLIAPVQTLDDYFGWEIDIEGDFAIVGTYKEDEDEDGLNTISDAGAAYIFIKGDSAWTLEQTIVPTVREVEDYFGCSVAISGDNIIIGAWNEDEDADEANTLSNVGSAYIFKRSIGVGINETPLPQEFTFGSAYPNPFNPRTAVSFQLSAFSNIELNIYNVQGILVDKLYSGPIEAGHYELTWDASNMPSGVYIVRMVAENYIASQKVVLIK